MTTKLTTKASNARSIFAFSGIPTGQNESYICLRTAMYFPFSIFMILK